MDQIIGEREAEKHVIDKMKREYDITVHHEESDNRVVFSMQNDGILSVLEIVPRVAAVRRNPPIVSAGRLPCMADIERVETGLLSAISVREGDRVGELAKKLMSGALEYQNQMRFPICFVEDMRKHFCQGFQESTSESDNTISGEDFFGNLGFQYICDRPQYTLNTETILQEMLERAVRGETVSLDIPNVTLQVVAPEDMLSLAHFVNARLCRQYGFFVIRSAAYFEQVQRKLLGSGGNLFQIMENGIRKGYFICTNIAAGSIGEVVFDQAFDRACYLLTERGKASGISSGEDSRVMARIVNMPEMLRHIAGNGKITVAIRLKDPVIAENDGLFIWYIDEGGSRMERVEEPETEKESDSSMRPEVTTTIGAFTAFLFSYMKLKQNAKFDSIYLAGPAFVNEIY